MTSVREMKIKERISMTRIKYSFQRINLEYDECEQTHHP